MDSLLRIFYNNSLYIRMASLTIVSFCSPLQVLCNEINYQYDVNGQMTNILNLENINNPQSILDELGKLEETFACSQDPIEEARKFFVSFVNEINFKYGMKLTIENAFHMARENIRNMQVSEEEKTSMFTVIQLLESGSFKEIDSSIEKQAAAYINLTTRIYWPWESKWFGLNKNEKHKSKYADGGNGGYGPAGNGKTGNTR